MKFLAALVLLGGGAWGQPSGWSQEFESAWLASSRSRQLEWSRRQAVDEFRADQARWLPALMIEETNGAGLGWSASAEGDLAIGAPRLTLVQRLPSGGDVQVSGQIDAVWGSGVSSPRPWKTSYAAEVALPLGLPSSAALGTAILETRLLELAVDEHRGRAELARAAADADLARYELRLQEARVDLETSRYRETEARCGLGLETPSALVAAGRELQRSLWEQVERRSSLRSAEAQWTRLARRPLPDIDEGDLDEWAGSLGGPSLEDWEVRTARQQAALEALQIPEAEKDLAPVLVTGFAVARPGGLEWQVSAHVGLKFTTDRWVQGPLREAARRDGLARWGELIDEAATAATRGRRLREARTDDLRATRRTLGDERLRLEALRDDLKDLVLRREVSPTELLESNVSLAELELLGRKLAWEWVFARGNP